jgi:hypothetical protein
VNTAHLPDDDWRVQDKKIRIDFWFVIVVALAVLVFAGFVWVRVSRDVRDQLPRIEIQGH